MNIFVLDTNPQLCAQYHCDAHVRKMILEYAQMMRTAHYVLDGTTTIAGVPLYKPTHINHPCTKWVRESLANYYWLACLWVDLCQEYEYRFRKIHLTELKLSTVIPYNVPNKLIKDTETFIPDNFVQAMPDNCKRNDAVEAYRTYYRTEKRHLAKWTNREVPPWYK